MAEEKAPAADFAAGALACASGLNQDGLDLGAIEASGWKTSEARGPITKFAKSGTPVTLFVSRMFAGAGQCVVDGYAQSDDQFGAIRDAIKVALAAKFGEALNMPEPVVPSGQAFVAGSLIQILSTERRPAGLSIRVTGMQMPQSTGKPKSD